MKAYETQKYVTASKIESITKHVGGWAVTTEDGDVRIVAETWPDAKEAVKEGMLVPGYLIEYSPDGFLSFAPTAVFEQSARRVGPDAPMDFGFATRLMLMGKKVARRGWNGAGLWVVLMPKLDLPPFNHQEPGPKVNDRTAKHIGPETPLNSQPYFALFTNKEGANWQPGWNPSTSDALANDWYEVS